VDTEVVEVLVEGDEEVVAVTESDVVAESFIELVV
jgi:hypothetical protein